MKKNSNSSGGERFSRLKNKSRKQYGKKRFQRLATAGKK